MICLQTDGRTDGHGEASIPPYNFVAGGIKMAGENFERDTINNCFSTVDAMQNYKTSGQNV